MFLSPPRSFVFRPTSQGITLYWESQRQTSAPKLLRLVRGIFLSRSRFSPLPARWIDVVELLHSHAKRFPCHNRLEVNHSQ